MAKPGKKYTDASRRYDKAEMYPPQEALELVKNLSTRKFDETVEAAFRLGVDPRKADQMLRGTVSLPAGTGKDVRVAVFAAGGRKALADYSAKTGGATLLITRQMGGA